MIREDPYNQSEVVPSRENYALVWVFNKLLRFWWLILLIVIAGALTGVLYASLKKPKYQSYLSFALDEGGSQSSGGSVYSLAAQFGLSLGGVQDIFTGDNILEIMQSRRMIEDALLSVDTIRNQPTTLIEFYRTSVKKDDRKNLNPIHFLLGENRNQFSYAKDSVLYRTFLEFQNSNIVARRPDKRLNIYEVMVTTEDEQFSKVFTDRLIDVTNSFYTDIRSKKSRETLEILEKRVPEMKGKLESSISERASVQDANLNPAFARGSVPLLKAQSNSQVYGEAYAEMYKNLEMARFQYLKSIPLMQVIDAADYPMLKIHPGKLKMALVFGVLAGFIIVIVFCISAFFRRRNTAF